VDAIMPTTGAVKVVRWNADVNGQAYSVGAIGSAPAGSLASTSSAQSRDVDVVMPSSTRAITASRVGTTAELRLWSVPASGTPSVIGSGIRFENVQSIKLTVLRPATVVAPIRTSSGDLVLRSISITSRGISAPGRGTVAMVANVAEIDVGAARDHAEMRFVAAARSDPSGTTLQSWRLTSAGQFQLLAVETFDVSVVGVSVIALRRSAPANDLFVPERYAIVGRSSLGLFNQVYALPSATGVFVADGFRGIRGTFDQVDAVGFGPGGLLTVSKSGSSTKLITWEAAGGEVRPLSDHTISGLGADVRVCAVSSTLSETDAIVASRDGLASLTRLRGFRIGDRPAS
jgi:hypothetical protein